MAAVGTLDSRFPTLVPRGSDLRRQLRCHGVPLAQDETWGGVLEEAASLLLCPLAVPLPSSLASPVACPWEPELSTPPSSVTYRRCVWLGAFTCFRHSRFHTKPRWFARQEEGPSSLAML